MTVRGRPFGQQSHCDTRNSESPAHYRFAPDLLVCLRCRNKAFEICKPSKNNEPEVLEFLRNLQKTQGNTAHEY